MSEGPLDWAGLAGRIGEQLLVSEWVVVDQDRIDRFADATDDRQWIHVDPGRAERESPLGATVAHGFLCLSLLSRFGYAAGLVPPEGSTLLNYGLNHVRFVAPVRAGVRIRDRVVLLGVEQKERGRTLVTTRHTVEIEGEEKPALVAESLVLLVSKSLDAFRVPPREAT